MSVNALATRTKSRNVDDTVGIEVRCWIGRAEV